MNGERRWRKEAETCWVGWEEADLILPASKSAFLATLA